MIRYIQDSIHWGLAVTSFKEKNFEKCLSELHLIKGKRSSYSEYYALLATVLIIRSRHDEARQMLDRAINHSSPRKQSYEEYVVLYSRYYLSVLDGDEGSKIKYLHAALKLAPPPIIKEWLPLS